MFMLQLKLGEYFHKSVMKNNFITILLVILISVFCGLFVKSKLFESFDFKNYSKGLELYKSQNYSESYHYFSKISLLSDIKAPALFRQARCAVEVGDYKAAKRNYSTLLMLFPNSPLYVVSEYNLAMLKYELNNKSARKHFVHIIKYYPDTDYALASEYYVASIDMANAQKTRWYWKRKDLKQKSLNHFIRYVKLSPDGRFVQGSINKIKKLGIVISEDDNLALAESYYKRELYNDACPYFENSDLKNSWAKFGLNEFKRGNLPFARRLTEKGLKYFSEYVDIEDIYEVIDCYLSYTDNKLESINKLITYAPDNVAIDYLIYLQAKYSNPQNMYTIYEKLFTAFPESKFSAEALYKTFLYTIDKGNYKKSILLGQKHLRYFKDSDTAPAVMFWIGKIYERNKNGLMAKKYYTDVQRKYPDSYYSFRAYSRLHKNKLMGNKDIKQKPVEFPYGKTTEQSMATKLVELGDYDFVSELYKNDDFVQSWIEYKKGNLVQSVILAQEAIKKMRPRPDFDDVRWRLAYPLNYYDTIVNSKGFEDSLVILSILREESHFNPQIRSAVGAVGLMQLMPATANELAAKHSLSNNLYDPVTNIRLGCLHFEDIKNTLYNENIYAVLAYNCGHNCVLNWLQTLKYKDIDDFVEKVPYLETQSYVKKVLRSYWIYSNIY